MSDRDFSTRLAAEVKQWDLDGIIDPDIVARVVSRYPCDLENRRSRAGCLIALLTVERSLGMSAS